VGHPRVEGFECRAMIRKKAKNKTAAKKTAKKKSPAKLKAETNPADVRKEVSKLVEANATKMAQAVIDEGTKGQLAPVRYLFEMASIFPPAPNGEQATTEEDCLAKMLLDRIGPAKKSAEEEPGTEAGSEAVGEAQLPKNEEKDSEGSNPDEGAKAEAPDVANEVTVRG